MQVVAFLFFKFFCLCYTEAGVNRNIFVSVLEQQHKQINPLVEEKFQADCVW